MKLNRRYKHNLKHNLSFYLATVVLTAVSIFLFLSILTTGTGLDGYVTDFAQRHNMEDAQFSSCPSRRQTGRTWRRNTT